MSAYRIKRELAEVDAAVVAAGPPPELPAEMGRFGVRPVDPDSDDPRLLAAWFSRPHLVRTWEQEWSADQWRRDAAYRLAGDYSRPLIFSVDGIESGYLEVYRVARDEIARLYPVDAHDLGLHVATADAELLGRGVVSGFIRTLADTLFELEPACGSVVLEPSASNDPMRRALRKRGWADHGEFDVRPDRRIALHILTRASANPVHAVNEN